MKRFWLMLILGLSGLPAAVIVFGIGFADGGLQIWDQPISDSYNTTQLLIALVSILKPLWLIAPAALGLHATGKWWQHALLAMGTPLIWGLPILAAGWLKGGQSSLTGIVCLALLGWFCGLLFLWGRFLGQWCQPLKFWVTWSLFWAWTQFAQYISQIIEYLNMPSLKPVAWTEWLIPPMNRGFTLLDWQAQDLGWDSVSITVFIVQTLLLVAFFMRGSLQAVVQRS
ncbi:MAG: hypothetical protein H6510_10535 [Acidobacteria bacterium]|nr:hypothetical protein [Acidobacteriota bacterium]MCB9398246.1 hypothetical protein [Acidobacteriota bacterium]